MTLSPGSRLGPYEIVAPLGAGGMGEVWRAKDTRLGREVAIKVLPAELAQDAERLRRFELEARAASALNHPNIVTVYEVGTSDAGPYLVLEKIDGHSLHELLRDGPLPLKRLLALAAQIAEGLAKAHGAGIVHRDLKPANVMVTDDGFAKILDFGLARLTWPEADGSPLAQATTLAEPTASGMILGTPGYLSPEQAAGRPADFRADQFALGALVYEMASGRRPFRGETTGESLAAVLRDEPEPLRAGNAALPAQLAWLVERCLAKDPNDRYASTRDLARDLADLKEHLSEISRLPAAGELPLGAPPRRSRERQAWMAAAVAAVVAIVAVGFGVSAPRRLASRAGIAAAAHAMPTFQPLTFRRGNVGAARFSADGSTVVYSAAWNGEPVQPFLVRLDSVDSRELGVSGANLLGVSSQGELALALNWRQVDPYEGVGVLGRAPLVGGTLPREVLARTLLADWAPDGTALAVVRGRAAGELLVEYPIGRELYRSRAEIRSLRVSPRGDRLALIESALADFSVSVLDLAGKRTVLSSGWNRALGLAWAKGGDEIWFTAAKTGGARTLFAVDLAGNERAVASFPGTQTLHDIAPDGTVLLTQETLRREMAGLFPGSPVERDLTWLDYSWPLDLSADGRRIVFGEGSSGVSGNVDLYLRTTDGGPAVRLGVASVTAQLSPDRSWILASRSEAHRSQLLLIPTGAGESRVLDSGGLDLMELRWMPDGKSVLFNASEPHKQRRAFSVELPAGKPRPLTPEGNLLSDIAPDGKSLLVYDLQQNRLEIHPLASGEERAISTATVTGEITSAWFGKDDDSLFVFVVDDRAARIERLDLAAGRHETWRKIVPADPAGVMHLMVLDVTPDGKSYVYSYVRLLSTLYAVRGLE